MAVTLLPGTLKQVVGTRLVQADIPGRTVSDVQIQIGGTLTGANKGVDRQSIQADFVTKTVRAYVDGMNDGNYVIAELAWDDSGERPEIYDFTMSLIQYQQ
jgi:hypothetical protein